MSSSERSETRQLRNVEMAQKHEIPGSAYLQEDVLQKPTLVADRRIDVRNNDERLRFMAQKPMSRVEGEITKKERTESPKKGSKDKKAAMGEPLHERIYNAEGGAIKHKKRDMSDFSPIGTTLESYRMHHKDAMGEMSEEEDSDCEDSYEMKSDSFDDTSSGQHQSQQSHQSTNPKPIYAGTVAGRRVPTNAMKDASLPNNTSSASPMPKSDISMDPSRKYGHEEGLVDRRRMEGMNDFPRQSPGHEYHLSQREEPTKFERVYGDEGMKRRGGREVDDEEYYTRQSLPRDPSMIASRDPMHSVPFYAREDMGPRRDRSNFERSRYGPLPKLMTYRITNKSAYMPSGYAKEDEIDYSTGEYRPKRNVESVTSPCPRVSTRGACEPKEWDSGRYIDSDHVQHLHEKGCPPTSY